MVLSPTVASVTRAPRSHARCRRSRAAGSAATVRRSAGRARMARTRLRARVHGMVATRTPAALCRGQLAYPAAEGCVPTPTIAFARTRDGRRVDEQAVDELRVQAG